jgi:hypothetical protein
MEKAHDFDALLQQAWDRHADEPAAVAELLAGAAHAAVGRAADVAALATIVHHVHGEHLARWDAGIELLQALGRHPAVDDDGRAALRRAGVSLALCAGQSGAADARAALGLSDRVRVAAMAAANLAQHDGARALHWLQQARAEAAPLDRTDPAQRALAVAGNNIACALEEKPDRNATERELMILAATTGREFWERAGGWLETERAEYRLAMTWLQAGDAAQARRHAEACRALVRANAGAALELFFASEALARAGHAAGDAEALAAAVHEASEAFAALDNDDRGFCQSTLDALQRLATR